ncbi:MAG: acyl-CoA dehydrogenase family protein [Rubrivivax sp.]|nr:acyl-CoA dehydrogenase family protein [Burkholderiales bacterium]MCW5637032.1 acyl-CoA dehydrogenase family protein [Rubrivivax sp.]
MLFLDSDFDLPAVGAATASLRRQVREFLAAETRGGGFAPQSNSWTEGLAGDFSRKLGERGWIGYHWPVAWGGRGGSAFDTLTINEELLAAGAPVGAHWIGARQSAPLLMRFGTETQRRKFLPRIAAGTTWFAIGMSEPDVGSDLASVRTRAEHAGGCWRLHGRKVWTSGAHVAHHAIVLCRTAPLDPKARHAGLSQFIVDLKAPGVTIRPIRMLDGSHHFNEVTFDGVELPADRLVGNTGDGWKQVTSELAYERSGPERFLSTMPIVERCLRLVLDAAPSAGDIAAGRLLARLITLRNMCLGIWGALEAGGSPVIEAAMVKDLGTNFERDSLEIVREAMVADARIAGDATLEALLAGAFPLAPTYTLRGGTNEVLRNMIAKHLQSR